MCSSDLLMYSSAYFQSPTDSLDAAQGHKVDRICRQLDLKPTDHVLEIGSGWGGFAMFAAAERGCTVTTLTVSQEQHALARARIQEAGLEDRVDVRLQDYRDIDGSYDAVVSIEMLEAVGHEYLPAYFAHCLKNGLPFEGIVSPAISRDAQEILQAGLRAMETGVSVSLPLPASGG